MATSPTGVPRCLKRPLRVEETLFREVWVPVVPTVRLRRPFLFAWVYLDRVLSVVLYVVELCLVCSPRRWVTRVLWMAAPLILRTLTRVLRLRWHPPMLTTGLPLELTVVRWCVVVLLTCTPGSLALTVPVTFLSPLILRRRV